MAATAAGPRTARRRLCAFRVNIIGMDDAHETERESGSDQAPSETAYELLQRGHTLLEGRHHAQAAIVLERADRAEPGKASILEALGRAYYNSGQHEPARATFDQLLELDPSAPFAHYALGQSLKRLGRLDEAGTHLRLAVALSPNSRLYRDALARLPSGNRRPPVVLGSEPDRAPADEPEGKSPRDPSANGDEPEGDGPEGDRPEGDEPGRHEPGPTAADYT